MKSSKHLVSIDDFCNSYNVKVSFINNLNQTGLIEITSMEEKLYVEIGQMPQLEKIVRLHFEMNINLEGIETIIHLLHRINGLQDEITQLRNRLDLYE